MSRIDDRYLITGMVVDSASLRKCLTNSQFYRSGTLVYYTAMSDEGYEIEVAKQRSGHICLISIGHRLVSFGNPRERHKILDRILTETGAVEIDIKWAYCELKRRSPDDVWLLPIEE